MAQRQKTRPVARRDFLKYCAIVGGAAVTPRIWSSSLAVGLASPSDKLNIGCIGVGNRGWANIDAVAAENIAAICDVDQQYLSRAHRKFPTAKHYSDFRRVLETEKNLDAVVVSTPDHTHAPATVMALKRGLHVYCEKPLTHSVYEARVVAETAARQNRVTQMGTQTSTSWNNMRAVELIQAGAIGPVHEVHVWAGDIGWPQGMSRPDYHDPVPSHLDWDLWIGPAPIRPYVHRYRDGRFKGRPVYHPAVWRGWWDFGTGKFGDQCCHQCNVVFWALQLGSPISVQAESSAPVKDAFPEWEIIRFQFPARGVQPPVKLVWYDGEKLPPPQTFAEKPPWLLGEGGRPGRPTVGQLFIGEKGQLLLSPPTLLPRKRFADYKLPQRRDWDRVEVHQDWIRGIKTGKQPGCHFGYSAPMTESLLLGNVALRVGQKIEWDARKFEVTNCPEANQYIRREYRKSWEL
jgi:predicted dehydrogenase